MSELEASGPGDLTPPYMIFVVVFLFFLTGLLGFLICHLLKKKGYRCRTGDIEDDEEEVEKLGVNVDDDDEDNQDTVEQILKCIIENEANMEAFNEMIGNRNVCVRHDPRLRKESIGGVPPHLHTVHSGTDHNSCHLCAQVKSKKGRRHSRTPRFKQRPGEQTVFSVGRFRVIHADKKLHGGPNPLVGSGDQLDQSQDSEERKEGGYNLRSMFKDVRPPSENTNGVAPTVGKRRKSLTIFGLRRGSDPVGVKAGDGIGRETGGVRFAIKQQPVVQEELSQGENLEVPFERRTKPGIKPKTEPSKNLRPALAKPEARTAEAVSPSPQSRKQANDSGTAPGDGLELGINLGIKLSVGSTAVPAPSFLPIPSPSVPGLTARTTERPRGVKMSEVDEGYDPGPLQTSTPIAPMYGSLIPTEQPGFYLSTDYPVTQTPPDRSSSPDLEPGVGANLALISLGSSPPSSYPIRTHSSVSSLKTPTSLLAITPSPKLGSRNTPSEATKTGFSPTLTPSPKLPSGRPASSFGISASPSLVRTPSPGLMVGLKLDTLPVSPQTTSSSGDQNQSLELSPRLIKGETDSSPLPVEERESVGANIRRTEEQKEIKRAGILKKATPSPVEGFPKVSALFPPTDLLSEDRPASLLLSPSSPLSPASPTMGSVAIIKASPDCKREFSVTMVEKEESCSSTKDQEGGNSELEAASEKMGRSPAVDQGREVSGPGVGGPEKQSGETSGADLKPTVGQERDDMVEMEDIRDCKVTQEGVKGMEEIISNIGPKQD
ncbi:RELT-like protein 2 [Notolabrus celidotus]|uniref:RELT-like protein 2 n=1 Tax=Notolabrus celidotus TaxID=1203425 RepID=UPI00148F81C8|nr:RELT-like protein 2 [Notolabrus celidotus]